jgi:hypothetical protein
LTSWVDIIPPAISIAAPEQLSPQEHIRFIVRLRINDVFVAETGPSKDWTEYKDRAIYGSWDDELQT